MLEWKCTGAGTRLRSGGTSPVRSQPALPGSPGSKGGSDLPLTGTPVGIMTVRSPKPRSRKKGGGDGDTSKRKRKHKHKAPALALHLGGAAPPPSPAALISELTGLRKELLTAESKYRARLKRIHARHSVSVANLLHYVRLRRHDLRPLQEALTRLGLSSLGRSEPYVMASLEAVLANLHRLAGLPQSDAAPSLPSFEQGRKLLARNDELLLGPPPAGRGVRIMVTLPSEAARDAELVRRMVDMGADVFRINCAHDDEAAWERMVRHVRHTARATGKPCRILMDLAGPKLRTGPVRTDPPVIRWRPSRDALGRITAPARVWIAPLGQGPRPPGTDAMLPLEAEWFSKLAPGGQLRLLDARGRSRWLRLLEVQHGGWIAECFKTTYVVPDSAVYLDQEGGPRLSEPGRVGAVLPSEQALRLRSGDTLILTRDLAPGEPALFDAAGRCVRSARIGCTLPEVFAAARPGERILFDDGAIAGRIRAVHEEELRVEITQTPPRGALLRSDKGINLPDSRLALGALTHKDLQDLRFVAKHADMVGLSFVSSSRDVFAMQAQLAFLKADHLGIVLKIETKRAFERLPSLLLAAMRSPAAGVMIARGDLAVECGYERLAELQEEILWISEAAHVPVIWATQVLESLAKEGRPSRAEITDAAMSERAECVMLNKGPYIVEAVRTLDDILRRMQGHQHKKRPMLRRLRLAVGLRGL